MPALLFTVLGIMIGYAGLHASNKKQICSQNKKPSRPSERVLRTGGRDLCGAHYVACLEAFRAFEQIELDGLAFVQRAVAVLLDGGEMPDTSSPVERWMMAGLIGCVATVERSSNIHWQVCAWSGGLMNF